MIHVEFSKVFHSRKMFSLTYKNDTYKCYNYHRQNSLRCYNRKVLNRYRKNFKSTMGHWNDLISIIGILKR